MTTDEKESRSAATRGRWTVVAAVAVSVVALVLAGVALAFAAVDYQPPPGTEPPKITDWMQGWAGVAGVVAGLLAAVFTAGLLVHEMREARRARQEAADEREKAKRATDRAEEERRDAEKLHARMVAWGDVRITAPTGQIRRVSMTFGNYGPGPILNLRTDLVGVGLLANQVNEPLISRGILAPSEVVPVDNVLRDPPSTGGLADEALWSALSVEARFTDMHGRKWLRRDNGEPEQVLDEA